ncbi:3,4-dihydroxy-2-butanone-4-phosphate synthase [Alteribacillus bidgolensis]|uniref:3,4-dihydroxy-2-butanone 4-phosphate synthase n=1 Tax=Alteribacillus bidgolensis TaxID=930129 RepID=A0A1G8QZP2_9BACI|nr:3,4-dihydroxy-2-butanone-4-phosphate synthase [Alteribacillus bidgolensis]SDJ10151.1 3,4-dihydroxy-2-butanone 4-phosphate synthase [Alteribacillus bidgolensis]
MSSFKTAYDELQTGRLIVLVDDINHNVSYVTGLLDKVTPEQVNFMIKFGKGLVYAGINKKQAERLELPIMAGDGWRDGSTISVDYFSSSTGISVNERAVTLQALNRESVRPEHFIRPGHVFPVVYAENGLLERRSIFEAAAELAGYHGSLANTFICELLNNKGEVASYHEVISFCQTHELSYITMSTILKEKGNRSLTRFTVESTKIPYVNHTIGFPNINLGLKNPLPPIRTGVYGIRVTCDQQTDIGIMHVNETEETESGKIFDMYVESSFSQVLANKTVSIEVNFFLRPLKFFSSSSIDDLVVMYKKDDEQVRKFFHFIAHDRIEGRFVL